MAGTLVANTINTDTGLFSTNNAYSGIAKAWVQFAVNTSGVVTINGSFNISSVSRTVAGRFLFTFSTAMSNINYSVTGSSGLDPTSGTTTFPVIFTNSGGTLAPTTSTFGVCFLAPTTGVVYDPVYASIAVNGA
jgi:hypothetical protein